MTCNIKDLKIAIIGLGYVGLPLALEFAKKRKITGFDIDLKRVKELNSGIDKNLEFTKNELKSLKYLKFTNNKSDLKPSNCFIITVPTPLDKFKRPNLKPILEASRLVGKIIKKEDLIIYESTVYPGCIEEECIPVLEKISKLKYNRDFYCGYSPERINPGDKKHTISNIIKITSGSTPEIAKLVNELYKEIIKVGTHMAPSIKVAEAAKVIENTQRDLNIALINELSMLFKKMNIDFQAILDAASTKWNFLSFKPGLVGGHCIGVDPYYLTYKSEQIGYHPKIILAGRKINDEMGNYAASELLREMKKKNIRVKNARVLIMGLTFKENCPDIRNSGVKNIFNKLKFYKCRVDLFDPYADRNEIKKLYKKYPTLKINKNTYDAVMIAVAHNNFKKLGLSEIENYCKKNKVIFDLKNIFNSERVDLKL
tara:strand:- start:1422 stop:2702 length:1281 start_codon:yes stop_codon:yes gene_type:complete